MYCLQEKLVGELTVGLRLWAIYYRRLHRSRRAMRDGGTGQGEKKHTLVSDELDHDLGILHRHLPPFSFYSQLLPTSWHGCTFPTREQMVA